MARPELIALLDDVKANPDDLTPWLVLTDWLEENGDEADRARAEYCRLCFDKLGKKTYASDWEKGERRRELFRTWNAAWLGPIAEFRWIQRWQMKRGLLDICANTYGALRLETDGLRAEQWAWVGRWEVNLGDLERAMEFAGSPLLEGPGVVSISYNAREVDAAFVNALAKSPYLSRVRRLVLHGRVRGKNPRNRPSRLFYPLRQRLGDRLELHVLP
jgi:uncharacterized protein (TIGR02996 family)